MAPSFDLDSLKPLIAGGGLLLFLAALVVALNIHGRRLEKHGEMLRLLGLRLDKIHSDRMRNYARSLQTVRPPPLSEARTTELPSDALLTLRLDCNREDGGHGETG